MRRLLVAWLILMVLAVTGCGSQREADRRDARLCDEMQVEVTVRQ